MSGPTIDGMFRMAVEQFPSSVFLDHITATGQRHSTSYGQAARRIAATVERLHRHGVTSGDMIVCYADDTVELVYFFLACYHAGVVPVPLAPAFSVNMVLNLVRRTRAAAVYSERSCVARLNEHGIRPLVCAVAGAEHPGCDALPISGDMSIGHALDILRSAASQHSATDPFIIIPTSGTTGESKLTLWDHRPMVHSNENLNLAVAFPASKMGAARFLLCNSLTHGLAMSNLAWALRNAGTICVPGQIESNTPLQDVRELDFEYSFMTPRVMTSLRDQWRAQEPNDTSVKLLGPGATRVVFAGAPPNADVVRLLLAQGVDVVDVWGSSETGALTRSQLGGWRQGHGGKPFPGIEVELGENNELLVRADYFMIGYHGDPELTRAVFTDDGFYRTGDAGEITADGRVRVTGRLKDVFNTFDGSNIYPVRIEDLIEAVPGVRQVVLIGDRLPFIAALVVVAPDAASGAGEHGLLEPERFPELYQRWGRELARINEGLEFVEKIKRFLLFTEPFEQALYRMVTVGKIRRDRAAVITAYAAAMERLYASDPRPGMQVPEPAPGG